jgi:hypothetical protein
MEAASLRTGWLLGRDTPAMVAPAAVAPRSAEDRLSSRPPEAVAAVAKVRTMASVEVEVAQRGGPVA